MRTITLEEHYATEAFLNGPGKKVKERANAESPLGHILEDLCELGEKRIANMDAAGIDLQVLSLTSPGFEQADSAEAIPLARATNDLLAKAIRKHPARLAGFAALPSAAPVEAAAELERTVRNYQFKGAMINGHVRGRYPDDKFFWPILKCAEALDVPIYIHPTQPPQSVVEASYSGFSPTVSTMLANAGWGWHIETGIYILRMILGGVFDEFPKLQVVIGHMGEALPFMLQRFETMPAKMTKLKRPIGAYLRENLHYTFSGFNFMPAFLNLLLEVGVDRIMFSADYPYASMQKARTFLDNIPVSPADRERIAHANAERLFRM